MCVRVIKKKTFEVDDLHLISTLLRVSSAPHDVLACGEAEIRMWVEQGCSELR